MKDLSNILKDIDFMKRRRHKDLVIEHHLNNKDIEWLKNDGYTVKTKEDEKGKYTRIEWE